MAEQDIQININARDNASATIKGVGGSVDTLKGKIESMQPAFKAMAIAGTAAFAAITGVVIKSVEAAGEAERQMASFEATLKTVKSATKNVHDSLITASNAAVQFGFDNEEAAVVLARFYQRTEDVNESLRLNQVAMDLARAKNIDLATAATLVNQVLSGNGRVLKQYGIDLKESGTPLEALGELHDKVGGQAIAFADTFQGRMAVIKVQTDNLTEGIGAALIPAIEKLIEAITPTILMITAWIEKNPELTAQIIEIGLGISALIAILGTLGIILPGLMTTISAFGVLLANPITFAVVAVAAAVFDVIAVMQLWKTSSKEIIDNLQYGWEAYKQFWYNLWDDIVAKVENVWEDIKRIVAEIIGAVQGAANYISSNFKAAGSILSDNAAAAWRGITGRASGGPVMGGTPYVVGEQGPELFIPRGNGTIIPNGGGGATINIYNPVVTDENMARALAEQIGRLLRQDFRY